MNSAQGNRAAPDGNAAPCYCGLWQSNPDYLRLQGIPQGFCGICQQCNRPGHTRHFPGSVPYTGCWCDACYRDVARMGSFRSLAVWFNVIVCLVILALVALTIYSFMRP